MSLLVTKLVRACRLPSTLPMRNRSTTKAVLLALADDCWDDGTHAFTSRKTLMREVEVSGGTIDAHLKALCNLGLIAEQAPPTQHHPRTWRLDLAAICALADSQAVATLSESEQQLVATLASRQPMLPLGLESQRVVTLSPPESQFHAPESQRVATEQREQEQKISTAAQTPRHALAREPNGDNFHVIKALAIETMKATALHGADLVEEVKQRCADLGIDYGRHEAVPCQVVGRACGWAEVQAMKAKPIGITSPRRREVARAG